MGCLAESSLTLPYHTSSVTMGELHTAHLLGFHPPMLTSALLSRPRSSKQEIGNRHEANTCLDILQERAVQLQAHPVLGLFETLASQEKRSSSPSGPMMQIWLKFSGILASLRISSITAESRINLGWIIGLRCFLATAAL